MPLFIKLNNEYIKVFGEVLRYDEESKENNILDTTDESCLWECFGPSTLCRILYRNQKAISFVRPVIANKEREKHREKAA
ncbi:hypothetical protein KQX54_005460 [Cotesia glomerata]|uniref:Uncharacterized protein n=1 Tax=Cotesia glomerata TaxID=32391 RepID=A0AAV7HXP1_COTGL|nr:hypothetical protein KQX54_005460 [Cotesia glomerata]